MESYILLQLLLLAVLTVKVDSIPIPPDEAVAEPTPPSIPGSTPPVLGTTDPELDSKLVFAFGNEMGQQKQIEIYTTDIPRANLSTMVDWLESLDQLEKFLLQLQEDQKKPNYDVRCIATGKDQERIDAIPMPQKIQQSLRTVKMFEEKIEKELRKPNKDWNYSAEKDAAVPLAQNAGSNGNT